MINKIPHDMILKVIQSIACSKDILQAAIRYKLYENILGEEYTFYFNHDFGSTIGKAINRRFSANSAIISLFNKGKVFIINKSTVNDILNKKSSEFQIDYSIGMDTQALSYLEPFISKRNLDRLPKDIDEIFKFISKPNVNIDATPYLYENAHNISSQENKIKIFNKLRAYEVLRFFSEKNTVSYEENILNDNSLFWGTDNLYSYLIRLENQEGFKEIKKQVDLIYLCILKMAEIQFSQSSQKSLIKFQTFLDFLQKELGQITVRESIIAYQFFEKETSLSFFSRVQKGKGSKIFTTIKNMAWDMFHLRFLERKMLIKDHPKSDHFFSAILTCDKDLIELSTLIDIKSIVINRKNGEIFPFYDYDSLGSDFNDMINEYDSFEKRRERESIFQKQNLSKLILKLEKKLSSY